MRNWRDVVGYEGLYSVSDRGDIFSHKTNKLRMLSVDKDGYLKIALSKDAHVTHFMVSRVVLFAFVGDPFNKAECNHINGIKADNRVGNLEWVTRSENELHAYKTKLFEAPKGSNHWAAKFSESDVKKIRNLVSTGKRGIVTELAKQYGVSHQAISDLSKKRRWRHVT